MNIKAAHIYGTQYLKKSFSSANLESRLLLSHVLKYSLEELIKYNDLEISNKDFVLYQSYLDQRLTNLPIAYIIDMKEFYSREFYINSNVLIPRPDTEILIDKVIADNSNASSLNILELGVGSGCIIITLLLELLNSSAVAVDISYEALEVCKRNSTFYNLNDRLTIIQSNWFEAIPLQNFDIIIANPPYIAEEEIDLMSLETRLYEPTIALFAENDGLACYQIIAKQAANFLKPGGKIYLEIGFNQKHAVEEVFLSNGFELVSCVKDLSAHYRVLSFKLVANNNF